MVLFHRRSCFCIHRPESLDSRNIPDPIQGASVGFSSNTCDQQLHKWLPTAPEVSSARRRILFAVPFPPTDCTAITFMKVRERAAVSMTWCGNLLLGERLTLKSTSIQDPDARQAWQRHWVLVWLTGMLCAPSSLVKYSTNSTSIFSTWFSVIQDVF